MHSFASEPSEKVVVYKAYAARERVSPPLHLIVELSRKLIVKWQPLGVIIYANNFTQLSCECVATKQLHQLMLTKI